MKHVRKLTDGDWTSAKDDEQDAEEDESEEIELEATRPGRYYKDQVHVQIHIVAFLSSKD